MLRYSTSYKTTGGDHQCKNNINIEYASVKKQNQLDLYNEKNSLDFGMYFFFQLM